MTHPDLALLTGADAHDLLAAAVATSGGELIEWRVRQVDHRPGSSSTASYDATVVHDGARARQTLGASVGLSTVGADLPGVLELSDGSRRVAVWRFPQDPGLPGLAAAADPEALARLLGDLGVAGVSAADVEVTVAAYRPRRRAVLRVRAPGAGVYVKVVRPSTVHDLHRRHVLLREAGLPVPRSLGWSEDGVLVLEPLTGAPMRRLLREPGAALPTADEVVGLLDRLPEGVLELPHRPAWSEHAGHYAAVVGAVLPSEADRARDLAAAVSSRVAGQPADAPTHGDLYEAQLLVSGGRISGLLDVDSAGPGRRADDLACLVAHVEVLATIDERQRDRLQRLSRGWARGLARQVDPDELRARVAGVTLSLATGPHRVQDPQWPAATTTRLDLVEEWLTGSPAPISDDGGAWGP